MNLSSQQAALLQAQQSGAEVETDPVACRAWRREHFIPVRAATLAERLTAEANGCSRLSAEFPPLIALLMRRLRDEFHVRLLRLKEAYAPFDPDADTLPVAPLDEAVVRDASDQFFAELAGVLERSNFARLSDQEIEEALLAVSQWGVNLHVDFSIFERLEVYVRGDRIGQRSVRSWQRFWRRELIDVPLHQRLVIVFRLTPDADVPDHDSDRRIYLRLFKNIPKLDVDMLLPGARICITRWDLGRIWLPTISGVAFTGYKLFKGAVLAAAFAGFYGMLGFLGLVAGAFGYGLRSFFGYQRTKDRYHLHLTRSLYYQNLGSNAAVLFRLLDAGEEQELREALLAAWILWREPQHPWTIEELDQAAEAWLREAYGVDVDFEVDDALDKLIRWGLVEVADNGQVRPLSLGQALACAGGDAAEPSAELRPPSWKRRAARRSAS